MLVKRSHLDLGYAAMSHRLKLTTACSTECVLNGVHCVRIIQRIKTRRYAHNFLLGSCDTLKVCTVRFRENATRISKHY